MSYAHYSDPTNTAQLDMYCKNLTVSGTSNITFPTTLADLTVTNELKTPGLLTGNTATFNTLTSTAINGEIKTAAQPSITSLGTLSSLTVSGAVGAATGNFTNLNSTNLQLGTLSMDLNNMLATGQFDYQATQHVMSVGAPPSTAARSGCIMLNIGNDALPTILDSNILFKVAPADSGRIYTTKSIRYPTLNQFVDVANVCTANVEQAVLFFGSGGIVAGSELQVQWLCDRITASSEIRATVLGLDFDPGSFIIYKGYTVTTTPSPRAIFRIQNCSAVDTLSFTLKLLVEIIY